MNDCEHYERLASTWLDDELDRDGQLELVDHLVRCEDCREFYRDARGLDGLVSATRPAASLAPPPAGIWERIRETTAPPAPRRLPTWIGWAATIAVVALGLGIALRGVVIEHRALPGQIEVQLGSDASSMSEARFVELTTEILQADRRYRSTMLRVLERVEREVGGMEASIEEPMELPEDLEADERGLAARIPA